MNLNLQDILQVLRTLSTLKWPVLILLAFYVGLKYSDRILIWVSFFEKRISSRYSWAERGSISNEIEGRINSFARKLNKEIGEILPYGVKIEWVEEKEFDRESFVKSNQVVIKMKHHSNRDRNLVCATLEYVSKGLIPRGRTYVSKNIMKSIDFKMVHKILLNDKLHSAIQYLFEKIVPEEVNNHPEIEKYLEKIHELEDYGYFAPVLLVELTILGKKLPPGVERLRKRAISETKDFLEFLHTLATRMPGEEVELIFIKKEIKVGVLIIAKTETSTYGKIPYIKRFRKNLVEDCERIYIVSAGFNIPFAKEISADIENRYEVDRLFESTLAIINRKGQLTKGYTCLFQKR